MKKSVREILISAVALMVIAAVVTAALAATNLLTKDKIATLLAEKETEARSELIADADFEEATLVDNGNTVKYQVAKKDGVTIGYIFTVVSKGKSSGLTVMTGVGVDGKVIGVKITDDDETAGYVDRIIKAGFLDSMLGKSDVDDVDTVSNATKTSDGVRKAVKKALEYYELAKGGDAE